MYKLKPKRQKVGVLVCRYILTYFNVKYTRKQLSVSLEDHTDYPSLLSLHDVLNEYGIVSSAILKGDFSYEDVETPYICSIQQEDWPSADFTVVIGAENNQITYLDPITEKTKTVSLSDFEKIDKGILLLIDAESPKDESNYLVNLSQENKIQRLYVLLFLLVSLFLLTPLVYMFFASILEGIRWFSLSIVISGTVGLIASLLLLWHDIDDHNPFFKEVCGGKGKKVNCGAVLNSKGANFLGISWSVYGGAYFLTFFLFQLLYPGEIAQMFLWSIISLLASPYIVYSIYYQWRVIKQWCPLCLTIQAVLLFNGIVSLVFITGDTVFAWDWYLMSISALLVTAFLVLLHFTTQLLKQAKDSRDYERKWKKLRYNSEIFQALLQKSDSITVPVDNLGILLGNPDAKHEIVKVCNPYCGPCSKAHFELENIIRHNSDFRLRIIFTATGEESDIKTPPVAHWLAIQQIHGVEMIHQALDDWYSADTKDYVAFAKKYPMNGELKDQQEKIKVMRNWCDVMKIRATPTVYINGKEIPDTYQIHELKNIL